MVVEPVPSISIRWIPALPLMIALLHGVMLIVIRRPLSRNIVTSFSCGAALFSFAAAAFALAELIALPEGSRALSDEFANWFGLGAGADLFSADFSFRFDTLSGTFSFTIAFVALLVHLSSVGFTREDRRSKAELERFYCLLGLLLGSAQVLVLADSLLLLFVGFQGMTIASSLLIAFNYEDAPCADAGRRALGLGVATDAFALAGILGVFWYLTDAGATAVRIQDLEPWLKEMAGRELLQIAGIELSVAGGVGLCFFVAAAGRAAQLPMHFWLLAGARAPIPAAPLIVLSSVTGIYLCCRLSTIFLAGSELSLIVAWTGAATALFAAVLALAQRNLLRCVIACGIGQMAFSFIGIGVGAFSAAVTNTVQVTIAQSLLLLGAGVVVHGLNGEESMRRMGGLRARLPATHVVMLIGAIAPAILLAREDLLHAAHSGDSPAAGSALFVCGLAASSLLYVALFRMVIRTFWGGIRSPLSFRGHFADPPLWVMGPLYCLAFLTILGLALDPSQFWGDRVGVENSNSLSHFIGSAVATLPMATAEAPDRWPLVWASILSLFLGLTVGYLAYSRFAPFFKRRDEKLRPLREALASERDGAKLDTWLGRPVVAFSRHTLERGIERGLIDSVLIRGLSSTLRVIGRQGSKISQPGLTQVQLLGTLAGIIAILWILVG